MVRIIEIKARCQDQEKIRSILKEKQAIFKGLDHQIDTYFKVDHGRLKLRAGKIENNLIHYHRENKQGPKLSNVSLYRSDPNSSLKSILENAVGVLTVVDKKREIFFIDNVKFHIDTVEQLGQFIEIEAIDENGELTKEQLLEQCQFYLNLFEVKEEDLVPVSYSDLLIAKESKSQ